MINTYRNKIIQHCISQAWCVWWANFSKFVLSDSSSNHWNLRRYCHYGCTVCFLFHTGHKHIMACPPTLQQVIDQAIPTWTRHPRVGHDRPFHVCQSKLWNSNSWYADTVPKLFSCCHMSMPYILLTQATTHAESLRCVWCCSRMMVKDMFVHVT